MEVFTYQVRADELDERLIETLKSLFKGKEIAISVQQTNRSAEISVAKPKQTLSEMIAERESNPVKYVVPGDEFSRLVDMVSEDENFDIMSELYKYKTLVHT